MSEPTEAEQKGRPCEKCGGPTYHVCSWVCVDICPKCDRMPDTAARVRANANQTGGDGE